MALSGMRSMGEESETHFVSDLLHVEEAIQITPKVHVPPPPVFHEPRPATMKTVVISPEVADRIHGFEGKVYDVSATLREIGLALPKGSRALYGPESQLLYLESIPDDLALAQMVFPSAPPPAEYTVDVQVVSKVGDREETLLEMKSIPLLQGRELKFNTTGREALHLALEAVDQPGDYNEGAHVSVDAEIEAGGHSVRVRSTWLMHRSKPLKTNLGQVGGAIVTLSVQTHARQGRWGDDPESEKENKAAAIKEIQNSLAGGK
jgi:hypothetical protein